MSALKLYGASSIPFDSLQSVVADAQFHETTFPSGYQCVLRFLNGFGASIVINDMSYGHKLGLYELAVLHHGVITYNTPLTNDVLGYLTSLQVVSHCLKIAKL